MKRPKTSRRDVCFGGEECDPVRGCMRHIRLRLLACTLVVSSDSMKATMWFNSAKTGPLRTWKSFNRKRVRFLGVAEGVLSSTLGVPSSRYMTEDPLLPSSPTVLEHS